MDQSMGFSKEEADSAQSWLNTHLLDRGWQTFNSIAQLHTLHNNLCLWWKWPQVLVLPPHALASLLDRFLWSFIRQRATRFQYACIHALYPNNKLKITLWLNCMHAIGNAWTHAWMHSCETNSGNYNCEHLVAWRYRQPHCIRIEFCSWLPKDYTLWIPQNFMKNTLQKPNVPKCFWEGMPPHRSLTHAWPLLSSARPIAFTFRHPWL